MTDIRFYHLTQKALDQGLPDLLEKALQSGKRIILRMEDEADAKDMSEHLWKCRRNGFFPHGIKGDGNEEMHPIWISTSSNDNPNSATTLIVADCAPLEDGEIEHFQLVCEIFDGANADCVSKARARWKAYKDAGHNLTYWQQTAKGGWEAKA